MIPRRTRNRISKLAPTRSLRAIAEGGADSTGQLWGWSIALAQYPGPVLLRWFWEFNVLVNNQNCRGDVGGAPTQQIYSDFIGAWRHIHQLFQKAGATDVFFLWNPGHYPAEGDAADPHSYYPGNGFVDLNRPRYLPAQPNRDLRR